MISSDEREPVRCPLGLRLEREARSRAFLSGVREGRKGNLTNEQAPGNNPIACTDVEGLEISRQRKT